VPLDSRTVVDYLLERGAIDPGDVLDRSLTVVDRSRRNTCFAVSRDDRPGLFVKQPRLDDPHESPGLLRDATLAAAGESSAVLALLAPQLRFYDPRNRVLVVELLAGAEELSAHALRAGGVAPAIAGALGRAVGRLHAAVPADVAGAQTGRATASILWFGQTPDERLPRQTPAIAALRDAARHDPDLSRGLAELREEWRSDAFVHGDLKWENVMVTPEPEPVVHLVDWETSGAGDAAWDVGGLLHAYLRMWVTSLPRDALRPDAAAPAGGEAIAAAAPSIRALWSGYRAAAEPGRPGPFLLRAVRYAGARMLQTAYESAAYARGLSPQAVAFAQLAANVMARPAQAARALFSLPGDAVA
jgi:aminoglycoside phosphotransferase (APT) family kinase protein